ncbi:hypothetical protein Tco_1560566, partial [Tanacetum coccineum]
MAANPTTSAESPPVAGDGSGHGGAYPYEQSLISSTNNVDSLMCSYLSRTTHKTQVQEDQDTQVKDKGGISNKKKKLERRMKIAELKKISARPDVVE